MPPADDPGTLRDESHSGKPTVDLLRQFEFGQSFRSLSFSSGGHMLAAGGGAGRNRSSVRVWGCTAPFKELRDLRPLQDGKEYTPEVVHLSFNSGHAARDDDGNEYIRGRDNVLRPRAERSATTLLAVGGSDGSVCTAGFNMSGHRYKLDVDLDDEDLKDGTTARNLQVCFSPHLATLINRSLTSGEKKKRGSMLVASPKPVKSPSKAVAAAEGGPLCNDEDAEVSLGTLKCKTRFYCGRELGKKAIPRSDGFCGPHNGPQCSSCTRLQESLVCLPVSKRELASEVTASDGAPVAFGSDGQTLYCGRKDAPRGGEKMPCGPDSGPACDDCTELLSLMRRSTRKPPDKKLKECILEIPKVPSHMLALEVSGAPAKLKRVEGTYVLTAGINSKMWRKEGSRRLRLHFMSHVGSGIDGAWVIDERCTSDTEAITEKVLLVLKAKRADPTKLLDGMDTDGEIWEEMEREVPKDSKLRMYNSNNKYTKLIHRYCELIREHVKQTEEGEDTDDLDEEMEKWSEEVKETAKEIMEFFEKASEEEQHKIFNDDDGTMRVDEDYFLQSFFRAYPKLADDKPSKLKPENTFKKLPLGPSLRVTAASKETLERLTARADPEAPVMVVGHCTPKDSKLRMYNGLTRALLHEVRADELLPLSSFIGAFALYNEGQSLAVADASIVDGRSVARTIVARSMKDRKVVKWLQLGGSRVVSGFASPPQTSKSGMVLGESERFASYDHGQKTIRVVDALSGHEVASFRVDDPETESEGGCPRA